MVIQYDTKNVMCVQKPTSTSLVYHMELNRKLTNKKLRKPIGANIQ